MLPKLSRPGMHDDSAAIGVQHRIHVERIRRRDKLRGTVAPYLQRRQVALMTWMRRVIRAEMSTRGEEVTGLARVARIGAVGFAFSDRVQVKPLEPRWQVADFRSDGDHRWMRQREW